MSEIYHCELILDFELVTELHNEAHSPCNTENASEIEK
jgi:hypothetical protein